MEHIVVILDDGTGEAFDDVVHGAGALPEGKDLKIVTKDKGTRSGNPTIAFQFSVQTPDGKVYKAQASTTVRAFQMAAAAVRGKYGDV